MAKIGFYVLDIVYKIIDEKPVILLFGKTDRGDKIIVMDDRFRPYFYAVLKEKQGVEKKLMKIEVESGNIKANVTGVEIIKKSYDGEEVDAAKIYVNVPKGVPAIKDIVKEWDFVESVNEYDIQFIRRYLIDKKITPLTLIEVEGEKEGFKAKVPVIKADKINPLEGEAIKDVRILAVDIETYNPSRTIDMEKNPIIMLALHGNRFKKVITWKRFKTDEKYIEFVKSESDLIVRFKELMLEYSPDIITGYFSDGFDFPYIQHRAKKYKIKLDFGLDGTDLKVIGRELIKSRINGILHLDMVKFVRNIAGRNLKTESYSLDNVSKEILGEGKEDVEIEDLAEVWDKHPEMLEKYCAYNEKDAELTYKLCDSLFPNVIELVKIIGQSPFDISRMSFSQLVEHYLLRQAPEFRIIAPNRPEYKEVQERNMMTYKGGFVYEPTPGIYDEIAVFDFRSLYPTIIASHNISQDSFKCSCCKDRGKVPLEEDYWFCTKKKGFIPTIMKDLITRRQRIKEMIKNKGKNPLLDARSMSLKLLGNAFYGYLGFPRARWYSLESARSTTAWGRHHIKEVIARAEKEGFNVIYGDTDSVFLHIKGKTRTEAKEFAEKINKKMPGIMELEYEGYYPRGIFVMTKGTTAGAKKKYALIDDDGKIMIKGFEFVRRNWSNIAKKVQGKVLSILLKDKDVKKAFNYLKGIVKDLHEHKIKIKDLVIMTQISKDISEYESKGPHVKAAMKMAVKGIDVGAGTIIRYVVEKGKKGDKIGDRVELEEDASQEDYDDEYYINNQILPSVSSIFEVFGYSKEDLAAKKGQKELSSYF